LRGLSSAVMAGAGGGMIRVSSYAFHEALGFSAARRRTLQQSSYWVVCAIVPGVGFSPITNTVLYIWEACFQISSQNFLRKIMHLRRKEFGLETNCHEMLYYFYVPELVCMETNARAC
jgi:hypothetical protein